MEDQAEYAGALHQEPMELVKCETNDLLVPAHAEIILEREIMGDLRIPEGPFGEFPGYRSAPREPRATYKINAITHLAPYLSPEERKWLKGARALFDCTWPIDWPRETDVPPRMSFNDTYPREVKECCT